MIEEEIKEEMRDEKQTIEGSRVLRCKKAAAKREKNRMEKEERRLEASAILPFFFQGRDHEYLDL